MDQMKQRFINAVTNNLSAAPDSTAKTELIEELADNLHHRYLDMTAAGVPESEAFEQALDDLGDVNELVDYLKSLTPEEELPKLTLHPEEMEDVLNDAMKKAREAMAAAQEALRNVTLGKRSMSWHSDDGEVEIHIDHYDDDHGEHPYGEDHEDEDEDADVKVTIEDEKKDVIYGFGYDKAKGGFFTQWGEWKGPKNVGFNEDVDEEVDVEDAGIPSEGLRGIDIQTTNGDVTIRLIDDENAPIHLEDYDGLEIKRTDDNVLAIRQGNTASSSFFFGRGIFSADVELYLPRRFWEFIQVSATNGDVTVEDDIEVGRLSVKTTCGDLTADCASCGKFYFKSASGDCGATGLTGEVQVETMSGDVTVHGHMTQVRLSSMSGDVELDGSFTDGHFSSMSGDLRLETGILPEALEVSSKSGDCQVYLPGDQGGFTLRYKTTSGDFRSQLPLQRTSRGALYQDGGDRTFLMSSISGDLRLRKF